MMISCGRRNTSDASVAGLRKKVFKAYLALAKCRVFFARHFAKRHILTLDGGRYFFLRGMVFAGFHCLPGRRLKWRSKGVQLALKGVQVIYTSASTFKKKFSQQNRRDFKTSSEN
jgi:hypothetical protein